MSSPTWRLTSLPRSMVIFRSFVESVSSTVNTLTICARRPWCHNICAPMQGCMPFLLLADRMP